MKHFNETHGHTKGGLSPTYRVWRKMWDRCTNKNENNYHKYGGRGITICVQWKKFENFLADMGERPEGTSLDRINNDGNYELSNCRWATPREQSENTRVNILVGGKTLSQIARAFGIKYRTVNARYHAGKPILGTMK